MPEKNTTYKVVLTIMILVIVGLLIYVIVDSTTREPRLKSVDLQHLADHSVTERILSPGSVGNGSLASHSVGNNNLITHAVTSDKIKPGTITGYHIDTNATITAGSISAGTLTSTGTLVVNGASTLTGASTMTGKATLTGGYRPPAAKDLDVDHQGKITFAEYGLGRFVYIKSKGGTITLENPSTGNTGDIMIFKSKDLVGTGNITFATSGTTALFKKYVSKGGTYEESSGHTAVLTSPHFVDITIRSDGTQYWMTGHYA